MMTTNDRRAGGQTGPDRLAVLGIEAIGHHGVLDFERRDGQLFKVDLALGLDTRPAARSDDLQDTVDYGTLVDRVRAAVESDPVDLIETVAQRIADAIVRALPGTKAEGASGRAGEEDDEAVDAQDQLIVVRMFHDQCTISADSSGELLHRRGYRKEIAKAPLRETLAAAMVFLNDAMDQATVIANQIMSGKMPADPAATALREAEPVSSVERI